MSAGFSFPMHNNYKVFCDADQSGSQRMISLGHYLGLRVAPNPALGGTIVEVVLGPVRWQSNRRRLL